MRRIRLQQLLTGALVTGVILLVAIGSGAMSAILHGEIIRGFERKMVLIATSVASFLDANQLERIAKGRELITLCGAKEGLFGIGKDAVLYEVKTDAFGAARPILTLPAPPGQLPLVASAKDGLVYGPGDGDRRLWQINLSTKEIVALPDLDSSPRFLFNQDSENWKPLAPAADHPLNTALSIVRHGNEILALMPCGESGQKILAFQDTEHSASRIFLEQSASPLKAIATVSGQLYGAGGKLFKFDATGISGDFPAVLNFADNTTEEYLEYRQPLLGIHERCAVTYLYAFGLGKSMGGNPSIESDIYYIVDAVTDPAWLPVGYGETLPEANHKGIMAARAEGRPFISEIMDYGLWGELKVSSSAVDKTKEQLPSMAGCDINVGTIRGETRRATFLMLGAGTLTMLAGLAIAYKTSRVIVRPLRDLQRQTLSWATGDSNRRLTVSGHGVLGLLAQQLETARRRTVTSEEELLASRIKNLNLPLSLSEEDNQWFAKYLAVRTGESSSKS